MQPNPATSRTYNITIFRQPKSCLDYVLVIWFPPLLPLLLGSFSPGVEVTVWVTCLGQIDVVKIIHIQLIRAQKNKKQRTTSQMNKYEHAKNVIPKPSI